jgi:hypothetical protein
MRKARARMYLAVLSDDRPRTKLKVFALTRMGYAGNDYHARDFFNVDIFSVRTFF